ncbi:MAG: metal ABC transporter permease [Treponema sp.]|nr:metal ABC transporter permease [Treponema sp.]
METLAFYLSYPFVRFALIVGVLIALCSSLFGVTLVLKRYSFIGDGLSHVAFGAMALATVLKLSNSTILIMPVTIIAAILLLKGNARIKGDAAIAMFSVGALALGYLILNVFSSSANIAGDVCSTLFGSTSILTLKKSEVITCIVMSVLVILFFIFYYNRIFAITFDETFAKATGTNAGAYNISVAVVTAVIIVLAMNLVGSLLISALIIFPALSSMSVFTNYKSSVIGSAVISVVCALTGMLASIMLSTPVGATIVVANIIVFAIFSLVGKVCRK